MNWYILAFKNFAKFSGRSRRKEYWMFTLFNIIIIYGTLFLGSLASNENVATYIFYIYISISIIPNISLAVRRLHDIDKSGWWLLISPIPFGNLILIIFAIQEGDKENNAYGSNPKQVTVPYC